MTRRASSFLARAAAAVAVAVVVVAGIWLSGGLITNDFMLAMVLTATWMVLAGAGCVLLARRRVGLRVPVISAYVLVALVAGAYLALSTLVDHTVNERVARGGGGNVLLARGMFVPVEHSAQGAASAIRTASGERVLTLTKLDVSNGPDLRVYLVAGPARDESEVDDFKDLGALKGNRGNQQYGLPRGLNLARYTTVVIWCRAFSVNFARAPLS